MSVIDGLLKRHGLISDQVDEAELRVILRELESVLELGIRGDVVELGCYKGTTSLFLARMMASSEKGLRSSGGDSDMKNQKSPGDTSHPNAKRSLYLYDSFAGLPEKHQFDVSGVGEEFRAGELAARKDDLIAEFKKAGLDLPRVKKGWFNDLTPDDLPSEICFAFLDGDYYSSIKTSLELVWPKLMPGSVVIIDDYGNLKLPGARKAVDEWVRSHRIESFRAEASLALLWM